MTGPSRPSAVQPLIVIYAALAGGVFLFAAVVLFVLDPLETDVSSSVMRLVWFGIAAAAMLGAGVIRGRLAGRGDPDRARTAAILVWALAEGQALLGIVGTMLTGDRILALGALAIFVWIWVRYPPRAFLESVRGASPGDRQSSSRRFER